MVEQGVNGSFEGLIEVRVRRASNMAFVGLIGVSRTLLGFEALGRRVFGIGRWT